MGEILELIIIICEDIVVFWQKALYSYSKSEDDILNKVLDKIKSDGSGTSTSVGAKPSTSVGAKPSTSVYNRSLTKERYGVQQELHKGLLRSFGITAKEPFSTSNIANLSTSTPLKKELSSTLNTPNWPISTSLDANISTSVDVDLYINAYLEMMDRATFISHDLFLDKFFGVRPDLTAELSDSIAFTPEDVDSSTPNTLNPNNSNFVYTGYFPNFERLDLTLYAPDMVKIISPHVTNYPHEKFNDDYGSGVALSSIYNSDITKFFNGNHSSTLSVSDLNPSVFLDMEPSSNVELVNLINRVAYNHTRYTFLYVGSSPLCDSPNLTRVPSYTGPHITHNRDAYVFWGSDYPPSEPVIHLIIVTYNPLDPMLWEKKVSFISSTPGLENTPILMVLDPGLDIINLGVSTRIGMESVSTVHRLNYPIYQDLESTSLVTKHKYR